MRIHIDFLFLHLSFCFEGAVEDGGEQGVQFGGGISLRVHFSYMMSFGHCE